MLLSDLSMADVEAYNKAIVDAEYSSSQVTKRLQFVKALIDRAGRPEHDGQVLSRNWDSRDVIHGKLAKKRRLPYPLAAKGCTSRVRSVHEHADPVHLWWSKLVKRLGQQCESMGGFYTLRHLGATEFGSREGRSIGVMKRWLGHSASSDMADVYMKPM